MFGKKKTEVEFKGVSRSSEKRNAIVLFVIEAVVVLIFIAGVLFVLNYFGIFPLSKINPNLFSWLPVSKEASPPIEVVSDIPGYTLKLRNEKELLELLESWGVYGKEYGVTYGATGDTQGKPLEKIVIHLVNEEQGTNAFGTGQTKESIYSSSLTEISPGRFDINIYISSSIIDGKDSNIIPSIAIRATFLSSIYKIINSYKDVSESQKVATEFSNEFASNPLMQMDFFEITKNR